MQVAWFSIFLYITISLHDIEINGTITCRPVGRYLDRKYRPRSRHCYDAGWPIRNIVPSYMQLVEVKYLGYDEHIARCPMLIDRCVSFGEYTRVEIIYLPDGQYTTRVPVGKKCSLVRWKYNQNVE